MSVCCLSSHFRVGECTAPVLDEHVRLFKVVSKKERDGTPIVDWIWEGKGSDGRKRTNW
jgi:hypothetical protein